MESCSFCHPKLKIISLFALELFYDPAVSSVESYTFFRQRVGATLVVHLEPRLLVDGDVHVKGNILDGIGARFVQPA